MRIVVWLWSMKMNMGRGQWNMWAFVYAWKSCIYVADKNGKMAGHQKRLDIMRDLYTYTSFLISFFV